MHQDTIVWDTLIENNDGGSTPINSDGSKNGVLPWFWPMGYDTDRQNISRKVFSLLEKTQWVPPSFCFLNVMSKMLRMVHQGERGNQVLDWVLKMGSAISRAPFFLDFLLSDITHLVFYYFQLEILKVNMVQLKYGTFCFSFSFQSLKNEINPI